MEGTQGLLVAGQSSIVVEDMTEQRETENGSRPRQRYVWPWFVLGAVLLAVVLSVLWLSHEIERTRQIRDANSPQTNSGPK